MFSRAGSDRWHLPHSLKDTRDVEGVGGRDGGTLGWAQWMSWDEDGGRQAVPPWGLPRARHEAGAAHCLELQQDDMTQS